MPRAKRDMIRFLCMSKGILLGVSDAYPEVRFPWLALKQAKWDNSMDEAFLICCIEKVVAWYRTAIDHLTIEGALDEDLRASCRDSMAKASSLLEDYGNNRRVKR